MGLFRKSIDHSKSSKNIDQKIKNLDEDLKKMGVPLDEVNVVSSPEKNSKDEKYDWRSTLTEGGESKEDLTEDYVAEVRERHNYLAQVEGSIEHIKNKEVKSIFNELYRGEVESVVEEYVSKSSEEIVSLREDLFYEINKTPKVDLTLIEDKLNSLAVKYNRLCEQIEKQSTGDPLLDKPVNIEQLRNHYQILVGRLQEQLASLGGGGEVRLEFLDDVDRDSVKVDGKYLQYQSSTGKWIGADASGGGETSLIIKDSGSLVGTAGTIDFGTGLSVSPVVAGIVTVTADFDLTDLSVTTNSAGSAALSYNNSNGVFTYTPPDLSSYLTSYTETDPVVAAINGIVKSNGTTISAATAGTDYLTPTGDGSGLTGITTSIVAGDNVTVTTSNGISTIAAQTVLPSRTQASGATGSIGAGLTADITITGAKSYSLLKVGISSAAWVRIYTDTDSRTSDESRSYLTDPLPGAGVLAEVYTTTSGISTFKMTPGVVGWNDDGTPSTNIYAKVTNNEGSAADITVTLTIVNLEA